MAFIKHGSPEKIEVIQADTVDKIVCRKCAHVLIRSSNGAKITFSGPGSYLTCKCGEVVHGL
jgi:RNase P subunit RPR2